MTPGGENCGHSLPDLRRRYKAMVIRSLILPGPKPSKSSPSSRSVQPLKIDIQTAQEEIDKLRPLSRQELRIYFEVNRYLVGGGTESYID